MAAPFGRRTGTLAAFSQPSHSIVLPSSPAAGVERPASPPPGAGLSLRSDLPQEFESNAHDAYSAWSDPTFDEEVIKAARASWDLGGETRRRERAEETADEIAMPSMVAFTIAMGALALVFIAAGAIAIFKLWQGGAF